MKTARGIRESYDRWPYPAIARRGRYRPVWRLPPLEWINAMVGCKSMPQRVLVAGCGTGNEAFALRRRLPDADITAVDFSRRSLVVARRVQRELGLARRIEFCEADLTDATFRRAVPETFDLISCHGVLSYIPDAASALRNLAAALAPDGVFYIGVNGMQHLSKTRRPALRSFGFDVEQFEETPTLRNVLRLFHAIDGGGADYPAELLAGDLFGTIIANLSLDEWTRIAGRCCGLEFRGSYAAHHKLRPVLNRELHKTLLPRSRPEAHSLVEQLNPSAFHPLVFTRQRATAVPWHECDALLDCSVSWTGLYRLRVHQRGTKPGRLCEVSLTSRATNTAVDLLLARSTAALLQEAANAAPRDSVKPPRQRSPQRVRRDLYLLELLGATNVLAP
jgi:SAM-dependent methyltransferase